MLERHNTIVCTFEQTSPRITAFDIHDCIHDVLRIIEHTLNMIETGSTERQIYKYLIDKARLQALLWDKKGEAEYKHHTGELSLVSIAEACMGTKCVHIANIPPEVSNDALEVSLATLGTVMSIIVEICWKIYRYSMVNGIRQFTIKLSRLITTHLTVITVQKTLAV